MHDWNDLKYVLETCRCGSTLAAARVLGASQTTVMRRIAALEQDLGLALFERRRTGYQPTDVLRSMLPQIEAIEEAQKRLERDWQAARRGSSGRIRLTAPELLVAHFLGEALAQFQAEHDGLAIEVLTSDAFVDLAAGDADLALRAGDPPSDASLFGRRIVAKDSWSICCSQAYAQRRGVPKSPKALPGHTLVTLMDGLFPSPTSRWLAEVTPDGTATIRHNSLNAIHASLKAGLGIGACPDLVSGGDVDLVRCFPIPVVSNKEIWLLAPERHRDTPHVRSALTGLARSLTALARRRLRWPSVDAVEDTAPV